MTHEYFEDEDHIALAPTDKLSSRRSTAVSTDNSLLPTRIGEKPKQSKKKIIESEKEKKRHKEELQKAKKYMRGKGVNLVISDKKLRHKLERKEAMLKEAAMAAAKAEILNVESSGYLEAEGMERTYKFKQKDVRNVVDMQTSYKIHDLKLPSYGPYTCNYLPNGRQLLIGGRKGHVAMIDTLRYNVVTEFNAKQTVKDVRFLHDHTMFAVAQKKYVFIYDQSGLELHCLRNHIEPNRLEFLPYHFLLASVGRTGYLKYQDTSTGQLVAEHRTKLGPCDVMTQNSYNAVLHLGHSNGTVTLWSPTQSEPLVKLLCHRGPLRSMTVDKQGRYMVTAGGDGQMKVWDIRKFQPVHQYFTRSPASTMQLSQMGMLAVGYGSHVQVWKDALRTKQTSPYMNHSIPGESITSVNFRPFDDVLNVGHSGGVSSLVIPGSGEPNIDTIEANPYQTNKQRREAGVHHLLDKLQPDMISLQPDAIGNVDRAPAEVIAKERTLAFEANNLGKKAAKPKKKMRGRNKPTARKRRNHANIVTLEKKKIQDEKKKKQKLMANGDIVSTRNREDKSVERSALSRFYN